MRDAVGNVQSVMVLGGGSEIAAATVDLLVAGRCRTVVLAVRDVAKVAPLVERFASAGATTVEAVEFDGADPSTHAEFMATTFERFGDIDLVISAFGILGTQGDLEADPASAAELINVNLGGQISALLATINEMKRQGHGQIAVLSSVAGERVRPSNAVYGASKAGLDGFAQAMNDSLAKSGVQITVVRPGFVHTKMTEGLEKAPFSTTPEAVANDIVDGLAKGSAVVWSPGIVRWVFVVMRHLPRPIWRIVSARSRPAAPWTSPSPVRPA